MNQLNISEISKKVAIPAKTRTVKKKSILLQRMEKLGIGHSFTIKDAEIKAVAPTVYATAKRIGIKVTLRPVENGVGVWRINGRDNSSTAQASAA